MNDFQNNDDELESVVKETKIKNENESETEQNLIGGILYKAGDVAKFLGISPDSVRYYANQYEAYLHLQQTKGGHLRFTDEDIVTMQNILSLLEKYSPAEVKAHLSDPNIKLILPDSNESEIQEMKNMLASTEYIINRLTGVMSEVIGKALSEQESIYQHKALLEDQKHRQDTLLLEEKLEKLQQQNEILLKQLELSNERLSALVEEKKSGKGIFGFFRK